MAHWKNPKSINQNHTEVVSQVDSVPEGRYKESTKHSGGLIFSQCCNIVIHYIFEPCLNTGVPVLGFVFWVWLYLKHD